MKVVNLENGSPTASQAMDRLTNELYRLRASGIPYVKIIHGYGSSGKGGAIKAALKRYVTVLMQRRLIKGYVAGEDFGPFSASGRLAVDKFKELRSDSDWGMGNDGITIIFFK